MRGTKESLTRGSKEIGKEIGKDLIKIYLEKRAAKKASEALAKKVFQKGAQTATKGFFKSFLKAVPIVNVAAVVYDKYKLQNSIPKEDYRIKYPVSNNINHQTLGFNIHIHYNNDSRNLKASVYEIYTVNYDRKNPQIRKIDERDVSNSHHMTVNFLKTKNIQDMEKNIYAAKLIN